MTATRVFVYGTLMRGGRYHRLLREARYVGGARTALGYQLYDLGPYPAMRREGRGVVTGELYEVSPPMLAALDRLEGHPDYYRRQAIALEGGEEVTSYLFVDRDELAGARIVKSGDWRRR